MNTEQQRIAIAKACGWTAQEDKDRFWRAVDASGDMTHELWLCERNVWFAGTPDYLNDLNAMHEAEMFIRNAQDQMRYASETLIAMGFDDLVEASDLNVDYCWHVMGATAAQRAKAFLKTLNLWTP
jgi:hypothetical protein